MSQAPLLAIVLEGGRVQWLITEAWPVQLPLLHVVIIDYNTEGVSDDNLTTFSIGGLPVKARCRTATPVVSDSCENFLSPSAVLAAMGWPVESERSASPIRLARQMQRRIQALDGELERNERPPTGDDYNRLHAIVNGWLIDIMQALGEPPD
ncbi:hypothetical protein BG46_17115 [Brucella anthropi]|uniref:hypothetical protein n=1 Tax=Brucella anthropi TaxID=529 RepID=UPI00044571DE|nr:hypothetical protein [Brucella anthropi]EXL06472.1 hypothetical protein BG46_17115 [Brucella anthropi]